VLARTNDIPAYVNEALIAIRTQS